MRKTLFTALALTALLGAASVARADDFNGQVQTNTQTGVNAYMDQQATNAQLADPTAPDSVRGHGNR